MEGKQYIQVCLPLRLEWNPWYSTTEEVHVGQRVAVHFARKQYVGVVVGVGGKPDVANVYAIDSADTGLADISETEMKLWEFVSSYYMCTLGEVYKAAYPAEKVRCELQAVKLSENRERKLDQQRSSLISRIAQLEKRLASKEADICRRHRPDIAEKLEEERDAILSQLAALRAELAALDAPPSQECYQNTIEFGSKPVLLRGAGRAGYYLGEILRTLDSGRSVMILEPETDFGFNLRDELSRALRGRLLFWTTSSGQVEKREVMSAVRSSSPAVVIGTRSSVFLPWHNLGLVIIDEEQDASYKQREHAPMLNGRDVAAMLARIHDSSLILGSTCPSLESLYNCLSGKYDLLELPNPKPSAVEIIDISAEWRKHGMVGNYSRKALDAIAALPEDALITVVRCYQTEDAAAAELRDVLPGRDPQLLTPLAARRAPGRSALTLVLQADSLFDRNDFRADEKALQLLMTLKAHTERLIVQCGAASHPVYRALASEAFSDGTRHGVSAALGELLAERRSFGLPPYTRLVDMYDKGGSMVRREVLQRDSSLASRKASLKLQYGALYTFDVDPL